MLIILHETNPETFWLTHVELLSIYTSTRFISYCNIIQKSKSCTFEEQWCLISFCVTIMLTRSFA